MPSTTPTTHYKDGIPNLQDILASLFVHVCLDRTVRSTESRGGAGRVQSGHAEDGRDSQPPRRAGAYLDVGSVERLLFLSVACLERAARLLDGSMRSSMTQSQLGADSARSSGEALNRIIFGSESMQKMVTQIAVAAMEQSHSTQSASANACEIALIIQRTVTSWQESIGACQQLAILTTEMTGLVGSFTVGLAQIYVLENRSSCQLIEMNCRGCCRAT